MVNSVIFSLSIGEIFAIIYKYMFILKTYLGKSKVKCRKSDSISTMHCIFCNVDWVYYHIIKMYLLIAMVIAIAVYKISFLYSFDYLNLGVDLVKLYLNATESLQYENAKYQTKLGRLHVPFNARQLTTP